MNLWSIPMHFIFPEQDTAKLAQYRKTSTINSLDLIWQTDGLTILGCETNMREREVSLSFAMLYLDLSKNAVLLHWTSKWPTVGCYHPIWNKTGTSNLYVFTNLFFFFEGGEGCLSWVPKVFCCLKGAIWMPNLFSHAYWNHLYLHLCIQEIEINPQQVNVIV